MTLSGGRLVLGGDAQLRIEHNGRLELQDGSSGLSKTKQDSWTYMARCPSQTTKKHNGWLSEVSIGMRQADSGWGRKHSVVPWRRYGLWDVTGPVAGMDLAMSSKPSGLMAYRWAPAQLPMTVEGANSSPKT